MAAYLMNGWMGFISIGIVRVNCKFSIKNFTILWIHDCIFNARISLHRIWTYAIDEFIETWSVEYVTLFL